MAKLINVTISGEDYEHLINIENAVKENKICIDFQNLFGDIKKVYLFTKDESIIQLKKELEFHIFKTNESFNSIIAKKDAEIKELKDMLSK